MEQEQAQAAERRDAELARRDAVPRLEHERRRDAPQRRRRAAHPGLPASTDSGTAIVATTPRGVLSASVSRAAAPCIAASLARVLASPVPPPEDCVKPRPLSATRT